MGVPKFYRWISERYPCLSEVVKEYQVPEFDNLYLDMNGIIHNCSHPNDEDPHFRISEEQIFKDIFRYIEVLFRIIQPKKVFFMAVDGVAPRAKMNQQRCRRFRSAKDAQTKMDEAKRKGEELPSEKRFDSNCITPGTKFMAKLQTQLEYFVQNKITHDTMWQGLDIYLSGHQTPGEGEHKIMEFIRHERSQEGYDVNTRHCLYGLDADLLVLALCSHEPHFSLLREEVQFTRSKSSKSIARAEETTFHLLHISILREYIEHEFQILKESLSFPFDLESIIDDWVLMGFLVGNDFIPHLPCLHISGNALSYLYECYMQVLPTLDGYLNEKGTINLKRFQKYLDTVSKFDREQFEDVYSNYKWLESKRAASKPQASAKNSPEAKSLKIIKALAVKQGTIADDDVDDDSDIFEKEFMLHKRAYYTEKFQLEPTEHQVSAIAFEYVLALQWICHYYYNGVQSWGWFYPYHYAPYVSDICNISDMRLKYKMGKPFLPFQQLLAVLPYGSKDCVPKKLWPLMEEETSPIGDFYPAKFSTDLNGKLHEWEAVVLIPFIDEQRLLDAMSPLIPKLSISEKQRNQQGKCRHYVFNPKYPHVVKSTLPGHFPDIQCCTAVMNEIYHQQWVKKNYNEYVKGLLAKCNLSVYIQGFPTLYHMPHTAKFKKQGVRVFQNASRGENMILKICYDSSNTDKLQYCASTGSDEETLEELQERLLGKSVYVNWPHMEEAKVVAVSDSKIKYIHREDTSTDTLMKPIRRELNAKDREIFNGAIRDLREVNLNKRGIDIGDTKVLVYTRLLLGQKYMNCKWGGLTLQKQWSTHQQPHAVQTVIKEITVKSPNFTKIRTLNDLFPKNADVFFVGTPHYGCLGKVVCASIQQVTIHLTVPKEPDLSLVKENTKQENYLPGWKVCQPLKISGYILSRITGSIYVYYPGPTQKWNIGLNLRFSKENCGVAGYTMRHNNEWLYSSALSSIVAEYYEKYPQVFSYLKEALQNNNNLDARKMFEAEDDVSAKLGELSKFLKSLPCYGSSKVHESSDILELSAVDDIKNIVHEHQQSAHECDNISISAKPYLLHRPMPHQGTMIPDKKAKHQVLDRVVNVREGYTVPMNWRGTIIGCHNKSNAENQIMLDVLFDKEFMGGVTMGGRCPDRRGYKVPACSIINLSYGERIYNSTSPRPVAVVKPTHHQANSTSSNSLNQKDSSKPKKILQKFAEMTINDDSKSVEIEKNCVSNTSLQQQSSSSNGHGEKVKDFHEFLRHEVQENSVGGKRRKRRISAFDKNSNGKDHNVSRRPSSAKNSPALKPSSGAAIDFTPVNEYPLLAKFSPHFHGRSQPRSRRNKRKNKKRKESADKLQEILLQEEKEKIKTLSSENNCNDKDGGDNSNEEEAAAASPSTTGSTAPASDAGELDKKMTFSLSTSTVTSPRLMTANANNYQQSIKPVVLENTKSNGGIQQESKKETTTGKDSTRNGHEKNFYFPEFSPAASKKNPRTSSAPQSKFDELKSWCASQKVSRPIYTYQQHPGNPQLCVANVRLWNNWQYTGTAQSTKHQAAEMAATNAISHLQANGVMMPNFTNNIGNPSLLPPFAGDRFAAPPPFYHSSQQQQMSYQPRGPYLPLPHHPSLSNNNEQATSRQNHVIHDQMRHHPFTGATPSMVPPHMYPCAPQLFHMPSSVPIRAAAIGYDIPAGTVRYPYVDPTYAAYPGGPQHMQPIVFIPPMAPYMHASQPQFVLTDTPIPPSQTHNHQHRSSTRNGQVNPNSVSTQQSSVARKTPTPLATSLPKSYSK